jgi:8-oxo-dGTP diphosphatase
MPRAQCIVHRENQVLMVKHCQDGVAWWCLPGGGIEPGETPEQAALRELLEECCVQGKIVQQTGHMRYAPDGEAITFLVDIGDQGPVMGSDPEFELGKQVIADVRWMRLADLPERDRAFLWAAGLLAVPVFLAEIAAWSDRISYPGTSEPEKD